MAQLRHRTHERLWATHRGSRRLLRSDLEVLDRYRRSGACSVLADHERSTYSQNGEDGIIDHLTGLMGIVDGVFAEVGAADGAQNCTRELAERGWTGAWVEGDPELADGARALPLGGRVTVVEAMVDAANVVGLLRRAGTPDAPDVMSVDIDCGNYWITERLLEEFSPLLLVVEVNGEHRDAWVQPRGAAAIWDGSWNYGASLRAYCGLAGAHGYELVGCDSQGVNAFFVRADMVRPGMHPADWATHYVPPSHRPGTLGHPRRSVEAPTLDVEMGEDDLTMVRLVDAEVIGPGRRRPGESVSVLLTVVNSSPRALCPVGRFPVRLSYRLVAPDGGTDAVAGGPGEPPRSMLATVVPAGGRGVAAIEVRLPEHLGRWTVVPTLVQEDVAWRPADVAEGVVVEVAEGPVEGSRPDVTRK